MSEDFRRICRQPVSKYCTSEGLLEKLKEYLDRLGSSAHNCPNCGGVLDELSFEHKSKTYFFTCYKIAGQGKGIVAQTDYNKFHNYLCSSPSTHALKKARSERVSSRT
jgi:hypothetical protein